jgi:hypothetical protein
MMIFLSLFSCSGSLAFHFRGHHAGILAVVVEGRGADPGLAADLADHHPLLSLLQDEGNPYLRELRSLMVLPRSTA